ncbi:MAG: dihydropteroate synthase [candidate division KSB1 bacterium]|nr:dihydropteroate synthase [candidate division KSB1 bacterium]
MVTRQGGKSVRIGTGMPLTIIGEKINPTGKKTFAEQLLAGDFSQIQEYAVSQVAAGAHILDVNLGVAGLDEVKALPEAVKIAMACTDVPLSIDTADPQAMAAALQIYEGKAILNSVTGEEVSLKAFLPLVKRYHTAVIALPYDESGPSDDPETRLKVAQKILHQAQEMDIPPEDVLIDGLARPVSLDKNMARIALETIRLLRENLGVNTVLGISNVSFGLPDRRFVNLTFLTLAVAMGLTCAITDPTVPEMKKALLANNLLLGYDEFAINWIGHFRESKL